MIVIEVGEKFEGSYCPS